MAESLKTILMSALASKATPAESDTLIVGEGNVLKKISFSQLFTYLKDKLGINTLNTNIVKNKILTYRTDLGGNVVLNNVPGVIVAIIPAQPSIKIDYMFANGSGYTSCCVSDWGGNVKVNQNVNIKVFYI